jgi:hypothetical protein
MGEGLGLFDFWLSRQPVSDDLAASLTKHGAILTEFIRNSDQHRPGVSLGDGALLDRQANKGTALRRLRIWNARHGFPVSIGMWIAALLGLYWAIS